MKNQNLLLIFLIFLLPISLLGQTGKIAGKIANAETGDAIEGVSVFLEDSQIGTYTKANGTYLLQNVLTGVHTVHVRFMGYKQMQTTITVENDITAIVNFKLEIKAVQVEGMKISANRAIARETPVSFTNIDEETIKDKYTTGDMPQMLDDVPGLFSTTSGLGEAEITMRGFDAQKIQILINGVPVNDPESQVVYWSNWTGLSSNVKSVQVQRGAGASLYGSGAFGGSVNIETMGSENNSEITFRTSSGYYTTDGKSADENGDMNDYYPINYTTMLKYGSGKILDDKFKFDISVERKAGDYYIRGTEYDGWSFGFETESKLSKHVVNTSLIYAPQKHNQARSTYDPELGKFLGREFNYTNHKWQENKYAKPQFSIRDRWALSPTAYLMTNLFLTTGYGGGSRTQNTFFDAESGAVLYKDLQSIDNEREMFAKYAYHVYNKTNYMIEGLEIIDHGNYESATLNWGGVTSDEIYSGTNTLIGDQDHSFKSTADNNHNQIGLNSYFEQEITENFNLIAGVEGRYWQADHYREGSDFRYNNPDNPNSASNLGAFMREYDYSSQVINTSCFARTKINIPFDSVIQNINLMLDGQYAVYHSMVDENLIRFYDFVKDEFIDEGFYISKEDSIPVYDENNVLIDTVSEYDDDDYKRTYNFFSPKFGINVNLNDNWNVLANYSVVYKEPKVTDWYDRDEGPGVNQIVDGKVYDLDPEKGETIEGGFGYKNEKIKVDATYYHTQYKDKIQKTIDLHGDTKTVNAGQATHQGVELSFKGDFGNFDTNASTTLSRNRWGDLNFEEIFYEDAADVEGKVVPFSPEKMASGGIGYTFHEMPLNGNIRIGFAGKWIDDYYTTYDNVYCKQLYYYDDEENFVSIGEHEFVENLLGTGGYDYDENEGYIVNFHDEGDYDREWILQSSKLPAFFELNGSLDYKFFIGTHKAAIKLNVNNILNKKDNYSKAYISKAYGMKIRQADGSLDDPVFGEAASNGNSTGGGFYPYLSPAPLLNVFLTFEYKF